MLYRFLSFKYIHSLDSELRKGLDSDSVEVRRAAAYFYDYMYLKLGNIRIDFRTIYRKDD